MAAVNLSDWLKDPTLHSSSKVQLNPMEPGAVPLFVKSSELLKQLPSYGYQAKVSDRESFETLLCRVLAQSISAEGSVGLTHPELPCQEMLDKVPRKSDNNQKWECKKTISWDNNHTSCPVICPLCPQAFGDPIGAASHVFGSRFSFAVHMLGRHKISPTLVTFGSAVCDCCGYFYSDTKALGVHKVKMAKKLSVGGFAPTISRGTHICDLCGKKFTSRQKLERHVQIHAKEHPLSDHISAEQRRTLIRIEYEQKRSTAPKGRQLCNQCDRSFANAANVRRHIRKSHYNLPGSANKKYLVAVGQSAYAYNLLKKRATSIRDNLVVKPADHEDNSRFLEEAVDDVQEAVDDRDEGVIDGQNHDCDGICNGGCVDSILEKYSSIL